jgi:glycosyltransferase involved in cell wall biosynthesis
LVTVLFHEHNRGKGTALRTGFSHVSGDVIVSQDADLEYDPGDWAQMLPLINERNVADVVYGSRFYRQPSPMLDDCEGSTGVVSGGSPDVSNWHHAAVRRASGLGPQRSILYRAKIGSSLDNQTVGSITNWDPPPVGVLLTYASRPALHPRPASKSPIGF